MYKVRESGSDVVPSKFLRTVGAVLDQDLTIGIQVKQEAQGLGALLDNMEDNDYIKLDNIEI